MHYKITTTKWNTKNKNISNKYQTKWKTISYRKKNNQSIKLFFCFRPKDGKIKSIQSQVCLHYEIVCVEKRKKQHMHVRCEWSNFVWKSIHHLYNKQPVWIISVNRNVSNANTHTQHTTNTNNNTYLMSHQTTKMRRLGLKNCSQLWIFDLINNCGSVYL